MEDNKKNASRIDEVLDDKNNTAEDQLALDDARRVKVLSPGMLVFKRFIRSKLAVTGFIILVLMFAFSFIGGILSPYKQSQMFKTYEITKKTFGGATYNNELRFTYAEDQEFGSAAKSAMMLAIARDQKSFSADGKLYQLREEGDNFYRVVLAEALMNVDVIKNLYVFDEEATPPLTHTAELEQLFAEAFENGSMTFEYEGESYDIVQSSGKTYSICIPHICSVASMLVYDSYEQGDAELIVNSADFRYDSEKAIQDGREEFESGGVTYGVVYGDTTDITLSGEPYATVSNIIVNPILEDVFISVPLKNAIRDAIVDGDKKFTFEGAGGETLEYEIYRTNANYQIRGDVETELVDMYASPSSEHWLGTDGAGMDILTRLMYGGRVSLMIGFVVVFIELFIGVVIGGISGYFGGIVDTCLMRFVDLFNCIPYWPMMIILGSLMDAYKVDSSLRIWLLMALLGVLGWTGIARVVRGQILSLREQDFMVAAEATGISTSRRIFKHLVPNVMPLLIVQATMSLGGIIITEATLSFLGLGVKFPLASWGSIINAATNIYVMTNFWFVWIPAGLLIFITVLGFNFVGDGLRDAFDPKMKR